MAALAIIAGVMSYLTVHFLLEDRRLAAQLNTVIAEGKEHQLRQKMIVLSASPLLDAPITEKTALSFFWFGDMDSHFRDPINFFVVPNGDQKAHKVEIPNAVHQVNVFVSAKEMEAIL